MHCNLINGKLMCHDLDHVNSLFTLFGMRKCERIFYYKISHSTHRRFRL